MWGRIKVAKQGLSGRAGMNMQKIVGEDGHALQGDVRWKGHADARCGPWHPGMPHTCSLK